MLAQCLKSVFNVKARTSRRSKPGEGPIIRGPFSVIVKSLNLRRASYRAGTLVPGLAVYLHGELLLRPDHHVAALRQPLAAGPQPGAHLDQSEVRTGVT